MAAIGTIQLVGNANGTPLEVELNTLALRGVVRPQDVYPLGSYTGAVTLTQTATTGNVTAGVFNTGLFSMPPNASLTVGGGGTVLTLLRTLTISYTWGGTITTAKHINFDAFRGQLSGGGGTALTTPLQQLNSRAPRPASFLAVSNAFNGAVNLQAADPQPFGSVAFAAPTTGGNFSASLFDHAEIGPMLLDYETCIGVKMTSNGTFGSSETIQLSLAATWDEVQMVGQQSN